MKFLCNSEFIHSSANKTYTPGMVYLITAVLAAQLIALDPKIELGALSFFTPVDEEATKFVKEKKGNKPDPKETGAGTTPTTPKPPTKAELIAKAKDLGIQGTGSMNIEQLKEVIAAAEKAKQSKETGAGTTPTEQTQTDPTQQE